MASTIAMNEITRDGWRWDADYAARAAELRYADVGTKSTGKEMLMELKCISQQVQT